MVQLPRAEGKADGGRVIAAGRTIACAQAEGTSAKSLGTVLAVDATKSGAPREPPDRDHAAMSRDLSHACWRCAHWGGFAHSDANHSLCSRLNASPVQASPAGGCAFWTSGPGDSQPAGWMPIGFKPWDGPRIYGKAPPDDAPRRQHQDRPYLPCEQFEYDQKVDAAAWRLTGELLNRARQP